MRRGSSAGFARGDVSVMGLWPEGCFKNRRVLVVGGTSGIGAGIAQGFLSEGAQLIVTGATAAEAEAARANLQGAETLVLDVRDAEAVQRTVGGLQALDHLVYAAGVIRRGEEHDPKVFDMVLDINLHGAMCVAAAARPIITRGAGTILTIASMLRGAGSRLFRFEGRDRAAHQVAGARLCGGRVAGECGRAGVGCDAAYGSSEGRSVAVGGLSSRAPRCADGASRRTSRAPLSSLPLHWPLS